MDHWIDFACSDAELTAHWRALPLSEKLEINEVICNAPINESLASTLNFVGIIPLFADILGIDFDDPGLALVDIAPITDDISWANGFITTRLGKVSVSWRFGTNNFILDADVPVGMHLRPILPALNGGQLFCDGEPVHDDTIIRRDDDDVELCVMPGAAYRFEVVMA